MSEGHVTQMCRTLIADLRATTSWTGGVGVGHFIAQELEHRLTAALAKADAPTEMPMLSDREIQACTKSAYDMRCFGVHNEVRDTERWRLIKLLERLAAGQQVSPGPLVLSSDDIRELRYLHQNAVHCGHKRQIELYAKLLHRHEGDQP